MAVQKDSENNMSQSDKFKEAARELECDESEERFEERLKKVVKPSQKQDD